MSKLDTQTANHIKECMMSTLNMGIPDKKTIKAMVRVHNWLVKPSKHIRFKDYKHYLTIH